MVGSTPDVRWLVESLRVVAMPGTPFYIEDRHGANLQGVSTAMSRVPAELLRGPPVAAAIQEQVDDHISTLTAHDVEPTLGTVLMSDDPAAGRFMDAKHDACASAGVSTRDVRLAPDAPAADLYEAIDRLADDPEVHALFVQIPLPDHVSLAAVRRRMNPRKDVDCFHPDNLGRLLVDEPRFVPATPAAVYALLEAYDVRVAGREAVVVGRSTVIGKPIAVLLGRDAPRGNATVTVCHSQTLELGRVTHRAAVVVTAAGVPALVDGSMLRDDATVIDVSAMCRPADESGSDSGAANGDTHSSIVGDADTERGYELVGDVDFESAIERVSAITPVPGGVGPVTLATILHNVVRATELATDSVPIEPLPALPNVDADNLD